MSSYNFQSENNQYVAQQRQFEPPLHFESHTITAQPRLEELNVSTTRIPLPSVQYGSNAYTIPMPFIARTGLDYLQGIPSIHIQQTFELNEMHSSIASQNRFTIRSTTNETIYAASESSTSRDRLLFGTARPLTMHILDRTHQEAITIYRTFPCHCFCFYWKPQTFEVWLPPGDFVGNVFENFSLFDNEITIENHNKEIIYRIDGLPTWSCCFPSEVNFRILSEDRLTQKGTISRIWNTDNASYSLKIYFSNTEMDVRHKALLLAAGFMLEYKFFQGKN